MTQMNPRNLRNLRLVSTLQRRASVQSIFDGARRLRIQLLSLRFQPLDSLLLYRWSRDIGRNSREQFEDAARKT